MKCNNREVYANLTRLIAEAEEKKTRNYRWKGYDISSVCDKLSIFDWWNKNLSLSQMKQMQKFLNTAEALGYTGYVCFKVGAAGCSHGMWAHKNESENGFSPDGEVLFHSFRNGDNYWDCLLPDGDWMHDKDDDKSDFTLLEVKAALANV